MTNESSETFINSLLGQMTIEEKVGQLNQAHPEGWQDCDLIRQGKKKRLNPLLFTPQRKIKLKIKKYV